MRLARSLLVVVAVAFLVGCLGGSLPGGEEPVSDTELSFTDATEAAGFNYVSEDSAGMGNGNDGVYVADVTNDLHHDVLLIGGPEPVLLRNTGGSFERTDALPAIEGEVQGALFFDHDNDGWEDLLLLRRGDTPVFLENREGTFHEMEMGFDEELAVPVAASAADYTEDGRPDVFIAQYGDWETTTPTGWQRSFAFDADEDNGHENVLYQATDEGFERVDDAGIEGTHWSMATSFVDLDGDGHSDIHVANDYYNDTIYWNDGDGTFTRETLGEETDRNGMSSQVADVTGNGHLDVFVTNIYFPQDLSELDEDRRRTFGDFLANRLGKRAAGNNLLIGGEDGFSFQGEELGLHRGGWGWGAVLTDLDSSGAVDVLHGTQTVITFNESNPVYPYPGVWYQQDGEFHRQDASGIGFDATDDRGVAALDFDRSGAQDIAIATYDGPYSLYRNDAPQGNSVQVVLDSGETDHTALGARVVATVDGEERLFVNDDGADYQSQDAGMLHVGLDDAETVDLQITWPAGETTTLEGVDAGQRIRVTPDGIDDRAAYEQDD